ncbi:hypothetical protein HDV03_001197 [Kappamyces sp. JEL0829]|nr:hypothetical protein HDV03_001197 [Kappamyces sp. JEL0829]
MQKVILASASPNRRELVKKLAQLLDIDITCQESGYAEDLPMDMEPRSYCLETARQKAVMVYHTLEPASQATTIIMACDTMILHQNEIIGKPRDRDNARQILQRFSNDSHVCLTGVVLQQGDKVVEWVQESTIVFTDISALIDIYLDTNEWQGKAGSYGIQGSAGVFVKSVQGCFYNIVGFPLQRVAEELAKAFCVAPKHSSRAQ